jgi:hypothetical protein
MTRRDGGDLFHKGQVSPDCAEVQKHGGLRIANVRCRMQRMSKYSRSRAKGFFADRERLL